MTHEERIIFDIAKLNKAISNAQLPDDLKNHLTCFNRLLNAIYEKYTSTTHLPEKNIVYASLVEMTSLHLALIISKHPEYNSYATAAYSRLFTPTPQHAYVLALKEFVNDHLNQISALPIFTTDSTEFVRTEGYGEALEYHLGDRLTNENSNASTSIDQFINRMNASFYIHKLDEKSADKVTHTTIGYGALNFAAALLMPPALPVTLSATMITYPGMTRDANRIQRSLHRVKFNSELCQWRREFTDKLTSPLSLDPLIQNAQRNVIRNTNN